MTVLHVVALAAVAVAGTATVLVRDPLRQLIVSGGFGLSLAVLFLVFGAPDVALSEIGVATVVVPVLALVSLSRMSEEDDA
jgi:energy-converting hydrogenase B subunit D